MTNIHEAASNGDGMVELIEQQALLDWYKAATRHKLEKYDWELVKVGDTICSVSATEPSILVNRVLGIGTRSHPTRDQLIEIRELYRDRGVTRFFLHLVPLVMDSEIEDLLTSCGYKRYRGWMKFARGSGAIGAVDTDLDVRRIGPVEAEDFAAIVSPAFDMKPESQPVIASLADAAGWKLFMSFYGGQPAGTGAIYIRGKTAYTDWGATHPDFRMRGSQTALLNARVKFALEAGCTTIVTMTGEAVPGDPQHSYKNILKRGFSETYLRENWIPEDS